MPASRFTNTNSPGGVKRIKELPEKGEVFALDFDLKLSRARYRLLERDADEPMYKVTLSDRTELYLTADHPSWYTGMTS